MTVEVPERILLDVDDAAQAVAISRRKLQYLINEGHVPVVRIGRAVNSSTGTARLRGPARYRTGLVKTKGPGSDTRGPSDAAGNALSALSLACCSRSEAEAWYSDVYEAAQDDSGMATLLDRVEEHLKRTGGSVAPSWWSAQ
jgi:hypothetical protein